MSEASRKTGQIVRRALTVFVVLMTAYGAAGMVGGSIPANAGWTPPAQGVRIYVENNGIHTDLVLPKVAAGVDWRSLVRAEDLGDPRYAGYDHVAFGWGDKKFYVETPTWGDVRPTTILAAAMGSESVVMHVYHLPEPAAGAEVRAILLRREEYRRLADYIRASFAGAKPGHLHGYFDDDVFYAGLGRYSAIETCNAWTGDALRHAGVRVGAWTPFPVTVMGWFPL